MKVSVAIVNGIVGPYMNFKPNESFMLAGMIRRFCEQQRSEARNSNYQVFGNSKAEREYTYSEDLAKAILWLVSQNHMPPLVNLGNNLNLSIKDYAEIICDCLEIDRDLLEFPEHFNQISDLNNFLTDNSLFINLSNFQYTDIYEAVDNTINWFRKNYNL
jgi:GDP-L-fucose synthase